uniref:Transferase, nesg, ydcK, Structural Genomics.38A n=1 Tax=Siphoviridae sp. cttOT32 TaxID=2826493 RepID=A0A8S5QMG1_9CAUD|nr:MAG TPA: Putative transferase, nesg, ydcK, Structural Genomics.38A [Siphoviridae sp. cttOT32]
MGLKKYEIITVGSDKRVRALRSWQVGDRYVNIGDVGGIVYDEKTLSQDGACWLFKGNFGFPGARIGGDSIVDVGEATLSATGTPNVDILGSSVVVGSKLQFASDQTAADAVVLTAADFEQGALVSAMGTDWETWKTPSTQNIRTKAPIFSGASTKVLKLEVPGYAVQAYVLDRDGKGVAATTAVNTGAGATLAIPAGQYFVLRLVKNLGGAIVPADATAAQITFTGTYETKLSIVDSRVEVNPATSAGTLSLRPGGTYTRTPGAAYPDSVIRNSKVVINGHATANRTVTLMSEFINTSAVIDASVELAPAIPGIYKNVKNLTFSGSVTGDAGVSSHGVIQATDCDNFAVSSTIFPGLAAAQTANIPFIFQGCNVPNGVFYHHAQIANTYKNIDFVKAQADLGKATANVNVVLVSSEVGGMYRIYHKVTNLWGPLVESLASVISVKFLGGNPSNGYATTIYKDAYFNGEFDFAGTNVFGNTNKHDASNTQDISGALVMGLFNETTNGSTISGVVANNARAVVAQPFRVSGARGISVSSPTEVECNVYLTDAANKIIVNTGYVSGVNAPVTPALTAVYAYIAVRKTDGSDILSLDEFKGVTVTVYNGCKIVNTGETAVNMKGNIRVEDNATLINASITGSGYFGGNAVMSGAFIGGCVYMRDNASFTKTAGSLAIRNLKMTENAYAVLGNYPLNGRIHLSDNARCTPTAAGLSGGDLVMKDNAVISGAVAVDGVVTMKDDAKVSAGTLSAYGDITLCGSYNQTVNKTWTGKRTITDVNAPGYDNNVKTQYDF